MKGVCVYVIGCGCGGVCVWHDPIWGSCTSYNPQNETPVCHKGWHSEYAQYAQWVCTVCTTVSMHSEYADMLWHWMATNGELNTEHLLPICTHVQCSKLYKKDELNNAYNERNDWNEKSVDLEIWGWRSFCQSLILSLLLLENDPGMLSQHSSSIFSLIWMKKQTVSRI